LCHIDQQFDRYLSGIGIKLINLLIKIKLVNGIPCEKYTTNMANSSGCLFTKIINHFKTGVGGCYIISPTDDELQEYNYYVDVEEEKNNYHEN